MFRTIAIGLAAGAFGLVVAPRLAQATPGMICFTDSNCDSDEVCESATCEHVRRRKSVETPMPPLSICKCTEDKENVFVKSFKVKNYAGGKASYTVEVCHKPAMRSCTCTTNGFSKQEPPVKISKPMPVYVGIYHHQAPPQPKCKQEPDLKYFMGLMDGGCATYSTGTALVTRPSGASPAWAFAEYGCAFTEGNEADNKAVEIPDLQVRIGQITTGRRPKTTQMGVRVPFRLCNQGGAMSSPALLGLIWEQPATSPLKPPSGIPFNAYKLSGKPLGTLACQDSVWWFPSSGAPKAGKFSGWVVADPKGSIPDSDRSNNADRFLYLVRRGIGSPHK